MELGDLRLERVLPVVGLLTAAGGTSWRSATAVDEHVPGGSALADALTGPATITSLGPLRAD